MTDTRKACPYAHIDAFAAAPFGGNQAAVIELDSWPDDSVLQAIGAENNFAETAFLVPDKSDQADWELRWFTPELEVALCGHATLAGGHYALHIRPGSEARDQVRFRTRKAGVLSVSRDNEAGENVYALSLPAMPTETAPLPDWCALLGETAPQEHQHHQGSYHVLRYDNAGQVMALKPDFAALKPLGDAQYICTAPGAGHEAGTDVISRVFVPGAGVDEDSVTGSAHAVLTPYWAGRLGRAQFSAFQASTRGGLLACRLDQDRAILSGPCITMASGEFYV